MLLVAWVVRPFVFWYSTQYVFTDHRIIVRTGIIARKGRDMPLSRVNDVSFAHSFIERFLNCGTLQVESAGTQGQLVIQQRARTSSRSSATSTGCTTRTTCVAAVGDQPPGDPNGLTGTRSRAVRATVRGPHERRSSTTSSTWCSGRRAGSRREEVAHAAGRPLEDARRLWRAMGFADVGDAVAFTDEDVDALRLLVTLLDRGVLDRATAVDVARSLGQTTSRLADWQVDTFGRQLVERGVLDPGDPLSPRPRPRRCATRWRSCCPALERLLVHGWRRQLAAARRARPRRRRGRPGEVRDGAPHRGLRRPGRASPGSPGAWRSASSPRLVERFESRSADVVAAHGGRV